MTTSVSVLQLTILSYASYLSNQTRLEDYVNLIRCHDNAQMH